MVQNINSKLNKKCPLNCSSPIRKNLSYGNSNSDGNDNGNIPSNHSLPLTKRTRNFSENTKAFIFCTSLLFFLSGSSEALATTTNLNHNIPLRRSHKFRRRNGWVSLSSSFRGGSLEPLNTQLASTTRDNSNHPNINGGINGRTQLPQSNGSSSGDHDEQDTVTKDRHFPCTYIAEADLPTDVGHFRLRGYRVIESESAEMYANKNMGTEPCLIYCTDKPIFGDKRTAIPIRIHDQCFTSEVFRSKRCDCKEQLTMSLEYIQKHGGAIIYLQQEGRGIGLANKIAAYALQDMGLDTVDANIHLGFPEDARQYGVVPSILEDMGISSIRLITNNPRKVERMRGLGIDVLDTIPMVVVKPNVHNRKYLQTKKDRMNHSNFGDLLSLENDDPVVAVNGALNGIMEPRKISGKTENGSYIEGKEMVLDTVQSTLDEETEGATAGADGYCFGRKSVEEAIAAVGAGELVVVVDDMNRENEGDFIMAADRATPTALATIIRYSSGVICVGMESERMEKLGLPPMLTNNEDPKGTAFSVTVDAAPEHGITTGISATERAITIQLLGKTSTKSDDLRRPGHIFPLRARDGGVLTRDGHTEASVDLARLAGRHPSGVLCEIVSEENPTEMARLPELKRFCRKHGFVLTSIVDIAQYRRDVGDF